MTNPEVDPTPTRGDALLIVDVQNDFLPGGALGVPKGDEVIPALNPWIKRFESGRLPQFATRDWHPADHCSFIPQGGIWPPHCIAETEGARFAPSLQLSRETVVISKASTSENDAYSGFQGTDLARQLRDAGVRRLFVGGLATDYCVLHTVLDGLREGFVVYVIEAAIRAVEVNPGDGTQALQQMLATGAGVIRAEA
mgnify:CR=1 FL=1